MATPAQIASPGVYVTDDIGLEVVDGTQSRVQLGLLPNGQYGLQLVGPNLSGQVSAAPPSIVTGTPGAQITDKGVQVSDGTNVRVTLGQISATPTYGLKVVSSDGTTVIVDGTSDMFKISATGTLSAVWSAAANTNVQATATITGSGNAVLASLWLLTPDNTAGLTRTAMTYVAPNNTGNVLAVLASATDISGGNNRMILNATNYAGAPFSGKTAAGRYYLLLEAGI